MGVAPAWALRQASRNKTGEPQHEAGIQGQRQQELWVAPPQLPLLSSDHGFESDRSTASSSSSVSSMSGRWGGLRYPHHGRYPCWEPGGHMKINLPVFKDEDTKDAVTYQSWHCDLMCIVALHVEVVPFSPMPSIHYKVTQGS